MTYDPYTDAEYEEAIRAAAVTGYNDPKAPGYAERMLDSVDLQRKREKEEGPQEDEEGPEPDGTRYLGGGLWGSTSR